MNRTYRAPLMPLLGLALVLNAVAEELRPLVVDYPPPKITGTPVPVRLSHLETTPSPAPAVMVPPGVSNVALGRPVSSSDPYPMIGDVAVITDGEKDSDDGFYVELDQGLQWVQIDLGQEMEVYAIVVWHYHAQIRAYHDVIVKLGQNEDFATGAAILLNNDHDNSAGLGRGADPAFLSTHRGRIIPVDRKAGRYVRLYSNGNTADSMNHYIEVEVYGRPKS